MDHDLPDHAGASPRRDVTAAAGVLGGSGGFAAALERWAADAAVDEAARQRARQRWLQVQAEEEASLAGTLLDLAEHGRPVGLDVGEYRLRGRIVGLGADFVAVRSERGQDLLVRMAAVEVVRGDPGEHPVTGDRTTVVDAGLTGVLAALAADRLSVLVRTASGTVVRGELRSAGLDVVRLRVAGDPPAPAWVPTDAVAVVVLDA